MFKRCHHARIVLGAGNAHRIAQVHRAHMQDVHQPRVVPGNRLKFQDPIEFPLKGAVHLKILAPDNLHRPHRASDGLC